MSPFSPDPSESPIVYPPIDIPAPVTPPPDFKTIGSLFTAAQGEAGLAARGGLDWFQWIWSLILRLIGALIGVLIDVITLLLAQVLKAIDGANPAIDQLIRVILEGMFGQTIQFDAFTSVRNLAGSTTTSTSIAALFQNALQAQAVKDGAIKPSNAAASQFLQMSAHMAFEGWLFGWVAELSTWDKAERIADLKDIIESSLGIGRLSRRALAAPMKIFVEDPYTWLLNQTYFPAKLNPGELVRSYLRGTFTIGQLNTEMGYHGYAPYQVTELINLYKSHLSANDLQILIDRGSMTQQDAITRLNAAGYDNADAEALLEVAAFGREQANARAWAAELTQMYLNHQINSLGFEDQVNFTALPDWEKKEVIRRGEYKMQNARTFLTLGEAETLFKKGLYNLDDFRSIAELHNYAPQDELNLELLLEVEVSDLAAAALKKSNAAQAAAARAAAKVKADAAKAQLAQLQIEEKGVSNAQYETLVEQGLRTFQQYYGYLVSKGIATDNALSLLTVLQNKINAKNAAAQLKATSAAQAKTKHADIAQLETAVKQGLITNGDFQARMVQLGFSPTDAELLGEELQGQIDTAATKAKALAAAKAQAAIKHVDLSQEERAVRLGIETIAQYSAFLDSKGFDPHDRDVLVSELQAQLATDQQTAGKKAAAAAKLTNKGITIAQLEKLVRAGTEPLSSYTAALATAGYDAADQQALTDYLQLQMQQDQQDLILHGHAAALVDQLGVSLADLERAVKLSVVPIATYQDALQRAGVSAADQQTLVANLAAQIKTTRAAQTAMQSVSKQVAAAGVTLASLEKDTVSGKLSITQFQALLAGYGVSATDVTDAVQLVQDEIDNAAAVKALVSQATARAAAKGLDLAQITAAYKAQVLDEATWRADVAGLGYDAADVEILFETLAAAQAATAAKSAAKTTAPAATAATAG